MSKANRPIEELIGPNRHTVRHILGRLHCMTPLKEQLRAARPKNIRKAPPELRRGWVKCVIETSEEQRRIYNGVTSGKWAD